MDEINPVDKMEEVLCRKHSQSRRQRLLERTPTAVVSEVFDFLNDLPSLTSDGAGDVVVNDDDDAGMFSSQGVGQRQPDNVYLEGRVNSSLLLSGTDRDGFLADIKSKDSGFASLERQRCEPSSLYDSFLENEDDADDAIESVSSNDVSASISESLYDDVDVSFVPRSISMDGKQTACVDDEGEDTIALAAERFGGEALSCNPACNVPLLSEKNDHQKNLAKMQRETHITVTMVQKPFVSNEDDDVYAGGAVSFSNLNMSDNCVKQNRETNLASHTCEESSTLNRIKLDGCTFDFVIEPKRDGFDLLPQSGVTDSYCTDLSDATLTDSFAVDDRLSQPTGSWTLPKRSASAGDESLNVDGAAIAVTPSDDSPDDNEEDVIRDLESIACGHEQTYATIDIGSIGGSCSNQDIALDGDSSLHSEGGDVEQLVTPEQSSREANLQAEILEGSATCPRSESSPSNIVRRQKLAKNPSAELISDDSSDEDVGVYAESFRRSNWVRVSQAGKLDVNIPGDRHVPPAASSPLILSSASMDSVGEDGVDAGLASPAADEVFATADSHLASLARIMHKRSDSTTTTASESEFKCHYVSRRKCLIQRADSQQEYHRLSARMHDQDKQIVIHRSSDSEDLGLHILGSHPTFITAVDSGSAAEKAGITEGLILVSVNDHNVLSNSHVEIVDLIHCLTGDIKLGVANSDFQPVRDLQATVMAGYMYKLGNTAFKIWKKRFFILRQDNCLYYYKHEQDKDPLGAIPLGGYTISRHTETSKEFCFKAEKYGGRTYYFIADNRDQMTEWVGALTEAAARSKKRKEAFLSVSSHNVGLPALHILKPECAGFLSKLSPSKRSWRRRYCVLKDACVYYYKDKNSVSALGVAHLHGYTVDVENCQRKKFSFSLQPPDAKMRIFYFSTDNETDKKRWVEALIHSIQRWVRVEKEVDC